MGFHRLIVEGEDKLLFHEVASTSPSLTDFGTIVEDICDFCNYFYHISLNVISRSYNVVARVLAAASVGIGALKYGGENGQIPPFLEICSKKTLFRNLLFFYGTQV